jgi:UDP-3-O-[3-hydroxymyristoyl] glucosamine N-acyltransferase
MQQWQVGSLARALGGTVEGDPERWLIGVLGLEDAGPDHLSFLANRRYFRQLRSTRAGAILVGPQDQAPGHTLIRCPDPYAAFARALRLFHPETRPPPIIDPRAVVEGEALGATVMAFAYVGAGATVGKGSILQPFVYVGAGAEVGENCLLMAGSVVMDGCRLGDRVVLNPGAVVGSEGFGFAPTLEGLLKIPQVGIAVVESDVELGAQSCVDRAAMGETRLGMGSKLDNFVQIGHAAQVGPHCTLVAYAAVAGSSRVGAQSVLAARSLVLGHLELAPKTQLGACSMLTESTKEGEQRSGIPAISHPDWLKVAATTKRIPELLERVAALERELEKLQPRSQSG